MTTTLRDLGVSAAINGGSTLFFLFAFAFLRLQPFGDRVYYPKWYLKGVRKSIEKEEHRHHLQRVFNFNPRSYFHFLDWVWEAIKMPESELIDHAGLDSAVFLRIYLLGLKIFIPIMIVGFFILVPINATDNRLSSNNKKLFSADIDRLSIANVQDESKRLWAHLLLAYVFTFWTCFVLHREYKKVAAMRSSFLMTQCMRPDQFTVLVRQIPHDPHESISERVDRFFRTNHLEYYLSQQLVYNGNKLAKLVKDFEEAENNLNYALLKHSRNPKRRPTLKTGFLGWCGPKVDAIEFYRSRIKRLSREAETERERVLNDDKAKLPAAFVSFSTRWGAAVCAQTQQCKDPTIWLTEWAPEPRDVYWKNLAIPYVELYFRKLFIRAAIFVLVFFFSFPVAFVQSLANLDSIEKGLGFLKPIIENKSVRSILQGFLPGLALKLFLLLLPGILMVLSKIEGHLSISKLERVSAAKQYYFMVVNVFFVSVLAGTAFQQLPILKLFLHKAPTDIPKLLGDTVPLKATFFISYIMVDGWTSVSLEILRLKPLIFYHFKNLMFVKTERDREKAMAPGSASFNIEFPKVELYFLLGIVYAAIAPFLLLFIVTFFGFSYLVYRHQVINVYDPQYESAAAFWPHIHNRIVASMVMEQLTLVGLLSTKKGASSSLLLVLPIFTICFHLYTKSQFEPVFVKYPLEEARARDTVDKTKHNLTDILKLVEYEYMHPVLKSQEQEQEYGWKVHSSPSPSPGSSSMVRN